MLCYYRPDAYEEMKIDKTSASTKYDICLYWYFLDEVCK